MNSLAEFQLGGLGRPGESVTGRVTQSCGAGGEDRTSLQQEAEPPEREGEYYSGVVRDILRKGFLVGLIQFFVAACCFVKARLTLNPTAG